MTWPRRIGGVLVAPRRTFGRLLVDDRAGTGVVLLLVAVACLVSLPVAVLTEALLARVGLLSGASALAEMFARYALVPVGALAALWLVALGALRVTGAHIDGRRAVALAVAAAHLYVPWFVLIVGAKLLAAAGVRAAWLPHGAVAALDGVSVARLLVGVAWSLALVPVLVAAARATPPARDPASSPAALAAAPAGPAPLLAAAAIAALALAGLAVSGREALRAYPHVRPILRGDVAPDFALPFLDSPSLRRHLTALRGKVVVVDFWATWCGPCVRSLPELDRLYDTHRGAGLEVVAVNRDGGSDRVARVRTFLAEHALGFPVAFDDGSTASAYRVARLPTTYVIDRAGIVRDTWIGIPDRADLDQSVREWLAAPVAAAPPAPAALPAPPASPAPAPAVPPAPPVSPAPAPALPAAPAP